MNVSSDPDAYDVSPLRSALSGQYVIERELGRGGMGIVLAVRDLRLDRVVAMKVLPPQPPEGAETTERFLREARTAAQLSHPNVVPVYHADEAGDWAFFVMALIDGESLADRVRERGPLPVPEAVAILRDVAWALDYAHSRGVIHRDVKPENVMIERGTNRAVVTDFGIAHDVRATRLTSQAHVLGTVHYMSPEQIGGGPLDGRSDLYALGVLSFHVLSGRLPFEDAATSALLVAHVTRPAPPLASVAANVPAKLAAVVDRCLAKDPADRLATCAEFAEAIGEPEQWTDVHRDGMPRDLIVSEERAAAIWRRASQLQAEASQRLERRLNRPSERLRPDGITGEGYRLDQVSAAAVEAGINAEFVALAVAEQPRGRIESEEAVLSPFQEAMVRRVLRSPETSLSVSAVVPGTPREVLAAIGSVFQGYPYGLKLREQVGPHPLDGGVLQFGVPNWQALGDASEAINFSYYIGALGDRMLNVTLHRLHSSEPACEVTVFADIRRTVRKSARWVAPLAALGVAGGGGIATAVSVLALGLGAGAALPAVAFGLLAGAGAAWTQGAAHRYLLRASRTRLEGMLSDLAAAVRSRSLFGAGEPDRRPLPRSLQKQDDSIVIMGI